MSSQPRSSSYGDKSRLARTGALRSRSGRAAAVWRLRSATLTTGSQATVRLPVAGLDQGGRERARADRGLGDGDADQHRGLGKAVQSQRDRARRHLGPYQAASAIGLGGAVDRGRLQAVGTVQIVQPVQHASGEVAAGGQRHGAQRQRNGGDAENSARSVTWRFVPRPMAIIDKNAREPARFRNRPSLNRVRKIFCRRRERVRGPRSHSRQPVIPPAPLTGDVGRGCGDASRALLFSAEIREHSGDRPTFVRSSERWRTAGLAIESRVGTTRKCCRRGPKADPPAPGRK